MVRSSHFCICVRDRTVELSALSKTIPTHFPPGSLNRTPVPQDSDRVVSNPLGSTSVVVPDDAEIISLRDRRVYLRPLQAQDRPLLEELVARTESHDLRMRFFGGFHTLPPSVLDQLMIIDPERRITLVASNSASGGRQEILAVARAHALTDGRAEFALLVRSDLKGLGIGSVLLDRLIARSRSRGISLLVADVLQENTRMLRLADKYGFHQEAAQLGTTRLVLDLDSLAA
jgi:acetyltransferase